MGLKDFREFNGLPRNPNVYWQRKPANRCKECGRKIRGPNHKDGPHHQKKSLKSKSW